MQGLLLGRNVFGSALPCAKLLRAVGARTGRALQHCCAHAKGEANEVPMARRVRRPRPTTGGCVGTTGILPVAATPGSYSFAHRRLSRRRPRGSAALPLVATSCDPPGERGAGGQMVAQRWRAPRCGNAQDTRCPSKPPRWRLPMLRVAPVITPRRADGG